MEGIPRYLVFFSIGLLMLGLVSSVPMAKTKENKEVSHNASDVRYLLWTLSNPNPRDYYVVEINNLANLAASPFDGSKRTYFVQHGFNSDGETGWVLDIVSGILVLEDANVISVDWSELADTVNYEAAVENVYIVATHSAEFIDWLTGSTPLTTANIHLIGHSLGAQSCGMTGANVKTGLIDRITGLDPAGPGFYDKPSDQRISKDDAQFVDIIHTNACPITTACVGLADELGHVDIYPNGGTFQEGCPAPANTTGENWMDLFTACSHSRSHDYFIESILAGTGKPGASELTFVSWKCQDYDTYQAGGCPDCGVGCNEMGFHVDRSLEGTFYLRTNGDSPFAKGSVQ